MSTDEVETQQIQKHIHHQRKTRGPEILHQQSTHPNQNDQLRDETIKGLATIDKTCLPGRLSCAAG